ncbi:MAG: ABC transporter permease [Acidobacteria bacterium]|nr:ABC transporter permease [Acidobacteriota bacterium]
MSSFLARRLLFALALVVVVSSSALLLARLAPGDVTAELGPFAGAAEIAGTRARFDLDRNPASQWVVWMARAARFEFGDSFLYNRPVRGLVLRAAANTAVLALAALALATLVGIPLGIVAGSRQGTGAAVIRAASLVCLSVPPLLTSLLLVFVAATTRWFPLGGMTSVAAVGPSGPAWLADVAVHLPLPVLALALPIAATFERLQAQAITDALRQPFALAAVARGLSARDVVLRHAWRVSLRPLCGVYGLAVGALLSGSFVVEFVTAWPGLGRLTYEALRARDIYLVAGCAAMGGVFLALGSLVGDLLLLAADPRLREAARARSGERQTA